MSKYKDDDGTGSGIVILKIDEKVAIGSIGIE